MTGLIIFFLIIISPYLIFQRKRYGEAKDKQLFLKTHFYQSNLWIILLIFISMLLVNSFSPSIPIKEIHPLSSTQKFDSLARLKGPEASNIDFQYDYLNAYADNNYLRTREFKLLDEVLFSYYDSLADRGNADIANWSKGYYYLKWTLYDSTRSYFNKLPSNFKFKSLALSELHFSLGHDSIGLEYLKEEAKIDEGAKEMAVSRLVNKLEARNDISALREVLSLPGASEYFPFRLHRNLYLESLELIDYYKVVIQHFMERLTLLGFIAALIVALVWLYYIIQLAFFQNVRAKEVLLSFLFGVSFTFLTYLLGDLLYYNSANSGVWNMFTWSVIGIGAIEELVKIIPLLLIVVLVRRELEAFEYILFASVSAIGFAFTENILYFDGSYGLIVSGRAVTAAVGHMMDSSVFAYGFVLAKYKLKKNPLPYFVLFWGLASLMHGVYDYFVFTKLYFFFILFFLLCARVWVTVLNNSINQSKKFSYTANFDSRKLQFVVTFLLTAILMLEYVFAGFSLGQETALANLIAALIPGGFLIAFLGSKLTSFNLIKSYWGVVNFSVNPLTDDIVSQNFVGSKIQIKPYHHDRGLIDYASELRGTIVRRLVLQNKERTFWQANDDAKWFLVKLADEIRDEGMRKDYVLIKLKDNYSSLNDQKKFMVHLLLLPVSVSFKRGYPMRKAFKSLGWAWIETIDNNQ